MTNIKYIAHLFIAYTLWTLLPFYIQIFKAAGHFEVIAHRILWSCLFLLVFFYLTQRYTFIPILRSLSRTTYALLLLSGIMIASNWLTYIYAIHNDNVLQASLGYFISPLLSIFMGFVIFKETITPLQWLSIALAAGGIFYLIFFYGDIPWIALILSIAFAVYSAVHKKIKLNANLSLFIETIYLLPAAVIYFAVLAASGDLYFLSHGWSYDIGLLGLGAISIIPLILFSQSLKHISFLVIGFIQFYLPSALFLIGIFWFDEAFEPHYRITFGLIWLAVILFITDALRRRYAQPPTLS